MKTTMSRIGKKSIALPEGVTVEITQEAITVKGTKGELTQKLHPKVSVAQGEEGLLVTVENPENKQERSLWGLFGSLVTNMVTGVTEGYKKVLEVKGVGYRVAMKGNDIELSVGFSHPVIFNVPKGITASVEENRITVEGIDKQLVGETAAQIRRIKKPEPYKGKGIKYQDEEIIRKVGKAASA
jgi:large subunit ribosomal protein L6